MIPGITVLNETTRMTSNGGAMVFFGIIFLICFGALLAFCIQECALDKKVSLGYGAAILICLVIVVCGILLIVNGVNSEETIYEVTISDEVSTVQLLEKYEIRSKEGLIYKLVPYRQD